VIGTLACAIAGVVSVVALMNAILLRPLPFADVGGLYTVQAYDRAGARQWLSLPTFADWQQRTSSFASLTALTMADYNVLGGDHAESILAALVSPTFFATLGVWPADGRGFVEGDFAAGSERAVILSHSFWQRRFGGDPEILGRTVRLAAPEYLENGDGAYTVVGIMPQSFWLFWKRYDVLVPLAPSAQQMADRRTALIDQVLGRLRPSASRETARRELTALNETLERAFGRESTPASVTVRAIQEAHFADVRPVLWLIGVAGLIVLVLAAVNVTTMLLALGISREREFAVRLALGATRVHLAIQGAAEGFVLALCGGAAGLLLGTAATGVVRAVIPRANLARIPGEADAITVDATVMMAVVGIVVILASILGAASVSTGFSRRILSSLRDGFTSTIASSGLRLRSTLLSVQLALAVALVLTSYVLFDNLTRLRTVDLGVRAEGLVAAWVNLSPSRFPGAEHRARFYDRVLERARAVPGVVSLGAVDFPFKYEWQTAPVRSQALAGADEAQLPRAQRRAASEDYFRASGISLLHGRTFEPTDSAGTGPVAVVSKALSQRLWPDANPLGQQVRFADPSNVWLTVVGVVSDIRSAPHADAALVLYRPLKQAPPPWIYLMARTTVDPRMLFEPLKHAVWEIDRDQPVDGPWLVSEFVDDSLATLRFVVLLAGGFTLLAAIIAVAGVYSLTAFSVHRATREIGVRKALGARTTDVVLLFVRRCVTFAIPGFLIGGALFITLVRVLASRIQGVRLEWGVNLGFAAVAFAAIVLLATVWPTRRAANLEPSAALRSE
jgi:putative ABC transport system permease protein